MTLRAIPVDFCSTWAHLGSVCSKIIRCEKIPNVVYHQSFSDVYSLCVSRPEELAPKLYDAVTDLLKDRLKEILYELNDAVDDCLLKCYNVHWTAFQTGLSALNQLFKYANVHYVSSSKPSDADMCYGKLLPTTDNHNMEVLHLGLTLWKTVVIDDIQNRLSSCLLREIANDRTGQCSHQDCIVPCLDSFLRIDELKGLTSIPLSVYPSLFEQYLFEESRAYYSQWASGALKSSTCIDYINKAFTFLIEETNRAEKYYPQSRRHVLNLYLEIVINDHLDFINGNIGTFVKNEMINVLKEVYPLLSPTNQYGELLIQFGSHVKNRVRAVLSDIPADRKLAPSYFVNNLLLTRNHFSEMIANVFGGNLSYRNEMDKAFETAINSSESSPSHGSRNTTRVAQYLCRYMDDLLRHPDKSPMDVDLNEKISDSILLFKYIEEKDIFKQYYQRALCYRLLFNPETSMDLEKWTIQKLNTVCGYEFTSNFHRMHSDIQQAPTVNENFASFMGTEKISFPFESHCHVLTTNAWPINDTSDAAFNVPVGLREFMEHFERYYKRTYRGRNLRWVLPACMAEMHVLFADRPYTAVVSALHAAVLLRFEAADVDSMTLGALRSALLTPAGEADALQVLRLSLQPLVELGLLSVAPDALSSTDNLVNETIISLNRNFTSPQTNLEFIYSATALTNAPTEEVEQVERQVEDDRRFFTQAAIVRIMKSRKTCKHSDLIKCVISLAKKRFQPPIALIKRCIEILIEKGYMERNPNDADQYNYLA